MLGIDGGATKTLAAVLDLHDRVLHLGHAGAPNEDAVGTRVAVKAVLDATDQALAGAGIAQASSRAPWSPSPAPTPTRSTATSTTPAPTTGSSSTTSSAPGLPPPAPSQV